ncbi:MAG: hybrid sensor histidine kinase/response regulator [Candidatus Binatia bacterium]
MDAILCVDDDRAGLATVARALREVAPVVTAQSGSEARAALGDEIAVVVSDYRMPAMLGTELLAAVRAHDASIGRILLTAYADVESLMDAINRGHVHRYVPKPWDPRELRAAVRQALDAAQAARARARLGIETARAYARLQELDALKTRFLTLAAHELRTPLHVLCATLEMLGGLSLGGEAPALVATAERHAAWLGRSVAAMTDLVRLSQPNGRRHGALCLGAVVRRVAADVRPFCAQRRLAFAVESADAHPSWGEADDLHRAVLNLCLNAVRFTPDGGRVTLALRSVGTDADDEISVADTGVGIPRALRPRLGEPFVTAAPLDAHHSDPIAFRSGGIGLGLAVVRAIVADHGGRLDIESEEGGGTIVRVTLPRVMTTIDASSPAVRE